MFAGGDEFRLHRKKRLIKFNFYCSLVALTPCIITNASLFLQFWPDLHSRMCYIIHRSLFFGENLDLDFLHFCGSNGQTNLNFQKLGTRICTVAPRPRQNYRRCAQIQTDCLASKSDIRKAQVEVSPMKIH